MTVLWWHWIALGLALIGFELVVPAFVIIWFGVGALLVGIIMLPFPSFPFSAQVFVWSATSIASAVVWFRYFREKDRTKSGLSKEAVVGEIGIVIKPAAQYEKGVVKFQIALLGADEWPCIADDVLAIGDRVKVVDVEGHVLKVIKF